MKSGKMEIRCFTAHYMVKDINFLHKLNQERDSSYKSTNTSQRKIITDNTTIKKSISICSPLIIENYLLSQPLLCDFLLKE